MIDTTASVSVQFSQKNQNQNATDIYLILSNKWLGIFVTEKDARMKRSRHCKSTGLSSKRNKDIAVSHSK